MKFKVNSMPYDRYDCPFYEAYHIHGGEYCRKCKLDGDDCTYFNGKDRDPLECRWLIDDETEESLKEQRY